MTPKSSLDQILDGEPVRAALEAKKLRKFTKKDVENATRGKVTKFDSFEDGFLARVKGGVFDDEHVWDGVLEYEAPDIITVSYRSKGELGDGSATYKGKIDIHKPKGLSEIFDDPFNWSWPEPVDGLF